MLLPWRRIRIRKGNFSKTTGKEGDEMKKERWLAALGGVGVGILNGLLGAGGGMLTVPLLEWMGVKGRRAHATSLAVILPLSLVSAGAYLLRGWVSLGEAALFLPGGVLGAAAGGWLLPRLNTAWVKALFSLLLLWAAWRMLGR